jgi:hypothetical protein
VNKEEVHRHAGATDLSSRQFFAIAATAGEKMVEVEVQMHAENHSANDPKDKSGQHLLLDRSINEDVPVESKRCGGQRSKATTSSTTTPCSGTSGKNG